MAEKGTRRVLELCQQAHSIGLAVVCLPELISTLCRLARESKLTRFQYAQLKGDVFADIADVDVCMVTASVLEHTINALKRVSLPLWMPFTLAVLLATSPTSLSRQTSGKSGPHNHRDSGSSTFELSSIPSLVSPLGSP